MESLPLEQRKDILETEIAKMVRQGWRVSSRTETSAQLERDKKASCLLAFILALFLIVPAILYLLLYRGTESLYIQVDDSGKVLLTKS